MPPRVRARRRLAVAGCAFGLAVCALRPVHACAPEGNPLRVGFYHDFIPVSYSADKDPAGGRFDEHRGYEADLLSALETMGGAALSRRAIGGGFSGIWLRAAGAEFDLVGGGITIREDRTRDAQGRTAIVFTSGHIAFTQTLLVRAGDAARLARYDGLTPQDVVAVVPGTTGEERLLQLTGLVDSQNRLRAGVRVETADGGALVADGGDGYTITAAGASANLADRRRLEPPADAANMPRVVYFGTEGEQLAALRSGAADAVARGLIGNTDAAAESGGALVVAARDSRVELGGFALAASDTDLAACLNERLDWLTDSLRIGYEEWRADSAVFQRRAAAWTGRGGPISQRLDRAQKSILPQVARALSASATATVSERIAAAFSTAPAAGSTAPALLPALATALRGAATQDGDSSFAPDRLHRLLPGASFSLSLDETDGGLPPVGVWGGGDWRRLSGGGGAAPRWDGGLASGHVGVDARLHRDLLAGLALTHTRGDFDYAGGGLELRMTGAHPYLAWRPARGVELWTVAGHGRGKATAKTGTLRLPSALSLMTAAVGGSRELLSGAAAIASGETSLSLKGDASTARLASRETRAPLEAFTAKTHRLRAALAVSHETETAGGARVAPSLEAGVRHDGGDGATGAGLELAAGLRYSSPADGVTVEARGRWLAAHRSSLEEWGAGGMVRVDPGAAGRGLSFSLAPSFGGARVAGALWERGVDREAQGARNPTARLDAKLGWGFAAFGGLLTPWGAAKLAGEEAHGLLVGASLAFGPAFALSVEGGRRAAADDAVTLRGDLRF